MFKFRKKSNSKPVQIWKCSNSKNVQIKKCSDLKMLKLKLFRFENVQIQELFRFEVFQTFNKLYIILKIFIFNKCSNSNMVQNKMFKSGNSVNLKTFN